MLWAIWSRTAMLLWSDKTWQIVAQHNLKNLFKENDEKPKFKHNQITTWIYVKSPHYTPRYLLRGGGNNCVTAVGVSVHADQVNLRRKDQVAGVCRKYNSRAREPLWRMPLVDGGRWLLNNLDTDVTLNNLDTDVTLNNLDTEKTFDNLDTEMRKVLDIYENN